MKEDIKANLHLKNPEQVALSFNRPNLTYAVKVKEAIAGGLCEDEVVQNVVKDMADEIRKISELNKSKAACGIIYAFKKKDCSMLALNLSRNGIPAKAPVYVKELLRKVTHRDPIVEDTSRTLVYRLVNLLGKNQI